MLKKCCYCGGKGKLVQYVIDGMTVGKYMPYFAGCTKCYAHTALVSTATIAMEEWNSNSVLLAPDPSSYLQESLKEE